MSIQIDGLIKNRVYIHRPLIESFMFLSFFIFGCIQDELSQNWQLDRTRILAAKAEPPEALPGETVSFQSLVFSPDPIDSVVWFACLPEGSTSFGCTIDPSLIGSLQEEDEPDIEALIEAGFAGAEPYFLPSWTVPEDALDGLSQAQQDDGLSALVTLSAIPQDAQENTDIEIAYKRFPHQYIKHSQSQS